MIVKVTEFYSSFFYLQIIFFFCYPEGGFLGSLRRTGDDDAQGMKRLVSLEPRDTEDQLSVRGASL